MPTPMKRVAALTFAAALLAPATTQAAMGGANAVTTSLRPDLRSATVQSTNAVDDTTTVRVCFNKAIASLPQAGRFRMGKYDQIELTASSATRSASNCADAIFPNDDATQYTYVFVDGSDGTTPNSGNSAVSTNGFGNLQDATALIGSKTNTGTRGFSTGPDLVGITVNNANATIDYTFDQRIGGIVAGVGDLAGAFVYNTSNGTPVASIPGAANRAVSSDGLTLRVNFPPGPQIQDAVRAYVTLYSVAAKGSFSPRNPGGSATRPGSGGFTDRPDLVAASISEDGATADFQFDQALTAIPGGVNAFHVGASFANFFSNATGVPTIVGGPGVGNTVRIAIAPKAGIVSPTAFNETSVTAWADAGAVTGAGGLSTFGAAPVGGNAGAFATGFTVGPEALTVTFDNATDVAHVLFDSRFTGAGPNRFKLLDDQGSQISAAAISVSGPGAPTAGKTMADVTFPAGTLSGARSLLLMGDATEIDWGFWISIPQVISPTAPAAKAARKFRPAKVIRRATKRR